MTRLEEQGRAPRREASPRFIVDDTGAIAVLAALTAPLLLAFVALAGEGGMAYFKHGDMQSSANAAAWSAAIARRGGADGGGSKLEAIAVAASLGYRRSDDGAMSVSVNSPPASGPHTANPKAIEVILAVQQRSPLARVLRNDGYTIRTRAVAIAGSSGQGACVVALDRSEPSALSVSGSAVASFDKCGVIVNSTSAGAVALSGGGQFNAAELDVVGGVSQSGSSILNSPVTTGAAPLTDDPYGGVSAPAFSSCDHNNFEIKSSQTLSPGVYCGGLSVKLSGVVASMSPGVYIVAGGDFSVSSNATAVGNGVTIIATPYKGRSGSISISSGASVSLRAPATGPFAGVAFYIDRATPLFNQASMLGGPSQSVTGAIYAPHTQLLYSGGATSGGGCTQIIAHRIQFQGNSRVSSDCVGVGVAHIGKPTYLTE